MELYTIGYEGIKIDNFFKCLNNFSVSVVADVRKVPFSRKAGFSKRSLSEELEKNNIEYVHFEKLGTQKAIRENLKQTGDYNTFFKQYCQSIENSSLELHRIHSMITSGEKVVLLCFEKDYQKCHRKIIAEKIKKIDNNGLVIKHINIDQPKSNCSLLLGG
jgi:uncharacterized protein (DUF488 family)